MLSRLYCWGKWMPFQVLLSRITRDEDLLKRVNLAEFIVAYTIRKPAQCGGQQSMNRTSSVKSLFTSRD